MNNPIKQLLSFAKAGRAFLRLARNPNDTDAVFIISRELSAETKYLGPMHAHIKQHAGALQAIAERRLIGDIPLATIRSLDRGTLGGALASYYDAQGLDPNFYPKLSCEDETSYINRHLYETHDIWHLVTGFDIDIAGELGLQSFYLAQVRSPLSFAILAIGFVNSIFYQAEDTVRMMNAINHGWRMGVAAKPLFGVDWSQHWTTPLSELRREFSIETEVIEQGVLQRQTVVI